MKNIVSGCALILFILILGIRLSKEFSKSKEKRSFEEKFEQISLEDRIVLDNFFRKLVLTHGAGHVFCGEKPMCHAGFYLPIYELSPSRRANSLLTTYAHFSNSFQNHNVLMDIGLKTWKKYASLFPMKNFAIVDYKKGDSIILLIINKKAFVQLVEKEIEVFRKFYGVSILSEDILDQALNKNPCFFDLLEEQEVILGTLLGYGKNNAKLFERKIQLGTALGKIKTNKLDYKKRPSKDFHSIEEELQFLEKRIKPANDVRTLSNLNFAPPVGFIANLEDPETIRLKKQYASEKKEIARLYAKGEFLSVTLRKLTCNDKGNFSSFRKAVF